MHFAGYKENPHPYMVRASLFVTPSRFEGFGLVLAEALAVGAPTIAADCKSGPREILVDGRYGRLVPVEDAAALAEEIGDLWGDSMKRDMLASRARERAVAFDQQNFIDSWERLVRQTARKRNKAN